MESWKSGSQMTRTIDLRHWAQRGDIVPRCRDRTFSALEGSVPMTVPLESGSCCAPPAHINLRCDVLVPHGKAPVSATRPGPPASLGPRGLSLSRTHWDKRCAVRGFRTTPI